MNRIEQVLSILDCPGCQREQGVVVQGLIGKLNDAPKGEFAAAPLLDNEPHAVSELRQWFETNIRGPIRGFSHPSEK